MQLSNVGEIDVDGDMDGDRLVLGGDDVDGTMVGEYVGLLLGNDVGEFVGAADKEGVCVGMA